MSVLAALLLAWASAGQDAGELRKLFDELDGARGPRLAELTGTLSKSGAAAGSQALRPGAQPFHELPLEARRARAQIVREHGPGAAIEPALALLDDPDRIVRADLIAFLASPSLRAERIEERIEALARVASDQSSLEGRADALRALARIDHEAAARALERLVREGSGTDQLGAASALAAHPDGRASVVELVRAASSGTLALSNDALVVLLSNAYGVALAELPSGGAAPADQAAFTLAARHPDSRLRLASQSALERFVDRSAALGQPERADAVLAALAGCGLDEYELALKRAQLQFRAGDWERALAVAREIVRRHPLDADPQSRRRRVSGELLATAALVGAGRPAEARALLDDGEQVLGAIVRERWDQREGDQEMDPRVIDEALLPALVRCWRAVVELAAGAPGDSVRVLEAARDTDAELLRTELVLLRRVAGLALYSRSALPLDQLFQHDLGPTVLLLAAGPSGGGREKWLELEMQLYRAFNTVTAGGVPGFERYPAQETRLTDPLSDKERRPLLGEVWEARYDNMNRWLREERERFEEDADERARDPDRQRELLMIQFQIRQQQEDERSEGDVAIRRVIGVSRVGITLAQRLRQNNRLGTARQVAERCVSDLEARRGSLGDADYARLRAWAEEALASVLMDQGEPVAAEKTFQDALDMLEGLRRDMEGRSNENDRALVRAQISGVLVGLAVNANVKLGKPDKALEYFERAYALDKSDFMRILLACYRARAGRAEEARETLRDVPVAPGNFYNLACTYALLGERELALDFLRRDFDELRTEAGARERQMDWARSDPDLASLRDDPRFQELVRARERESERK